MERLVKENEANAAIPSEAVGAPTTERSRIPFSTPVARLAVPEIPGYHLHWFMGTAQRIQRAVDGGYEFVEKAEVKLNNRVLGSDTAQDGNTDMGSRVSIIAGSETGPDGQAVRLILMKIKQEWWEEDQKALVSDGSRVENVRKSLLGGLAGAEREDRTDTAQRYVDKSRTKIPDFLKRKA